MMLRSRMDPIGVIAPSRHSCRSGWVMRKLYHYGRTDPGAAGIRPPLPYRNSRPKNERCSSGTGTGVPEGAADAVSPDISAGVDAIADSTLCVSRSGTFWRCVVVGLRCLDLREPRLCGAEL